MTVSIWAWAGTLAGFAVLLVADLRLARNAGGLRASTVAICWRRPSAWTTSLSSCCCPVRRNYASGRFVVRAGGRLAATALLVAVVAVLGLRALYFVLAGSVDRFVLLKPGIALLLVVVGVKMLISPAVELLVWASLAVIFAVVAAAVGLSVWRDRR